MEDVKKMIDEEVERGIGTLKQYKPDSKEYASAMENISKLCNVSIGMTKDDRDFQLRCDEDARKEAELELRSAELDLKEKEIKEHKRSRWMQFAIDGVKFIGGTALAIWFACSGFEFEKTGNFTSPTFKNGFGLFKPKI